MVLGSSNKINYVLVALIRQLLVGCFPGAWIYLVVKLVLETSALRSVVLFLIPCVPLRLIAVDIESFKNPSWCFEHPVEI